MKIIKSILLSALVALMLVGFAPALTANMSTGSPVNHELAKGGDHGGYHGGGHHGDHWNGGWGGGWGGRSYYYNSSPYYYYNNPGYDTYYYNDPYYYDNNSNGLYFQFGF